MRAIFLSGLTIEKMRAEELTQPLKLGSQPTKKNVRAAENCRCWCTDPISSCFTASLEYIFLQRNSERWGMGMCLQCHRRGALACRQDPRWRVQGSEDSIEPEEGVPGLHLLGTVEAYLIPLKNHRLDQSSWVFLIRIGINWETKFQG